jgi:hypothetical protein
VIGRPGKTLLYLLVGVVAVAYLVLFQGKAASAKDYVEPVGTIASVLALLVVAWDGLLWRMPILNRVARVPNIRGTWRGTLRSSWVDPDTGRTPEPNDDVYLVVRQTYWGVSSQLMTSESRSQSVTGAVMNVGDGQYSLVCVYQNVARARTMQRDRR